MIELGKVLRTRGFSQGFIASELGISRQQFSRIVNNRTGITIPLIYKLAAITGLPVAELAAAIIPELKEYVHGTRTQACDFTRAKEPA